MTRVGACTALLILMTCSASPTHAGEGFGGLGGKTIVTLMRTSPPIVLLPATTIKVHPEPAHERALAERLAALVEVQLLAGDKRLSAAGPAAQVLIRVSVLESHGSREWQTSTYTVEKRGGGQATVVKRTLAVQYKLAATYSASDVHSGSSIDSASITLPYRASFDEGQDAPQIDQLASDALDQAAHQIVARLTFTRDPLQVLIPEGSLSPIKGLARAGAWNKYLEALEALPPRPKPADDAYRQFALGIAHEALAYSAEDAQIALNYLEQAALQYDKAVTMKPDEKYFLGGFSGSWLTGLVKKTGLVRVPTPDAAPPLTRVQESIARYQRVKELRAAATASPASPETRADGSKTLQEPRVPTAPVAQFDNLAVIRMVKAGIADDVILTAIRSSPRTAFDVSSAGLIQLSEGGVATALLREMQATAKPRSTRRAARPAGSGAQALSGLPRP